jgi:hypothetical protein
MAHGISRGYGRRRKPLQSKEKIERLAALHGIPLSNGDANGGTVDQGEGEPVGARARPGPHPPLRPAAGPRVRPSSRGCPLPLAFLSSSVLTMTLYRLLDGQ